MSLIQKIKTLTDLDYYFLSVSEDPNVRKFTLKTRVMLGILTVKYAKAYLWKGVETNEAMMRARRIAWSKLDPEAFIKITVSEIRMYQDLASI